MSHVSFSAATDTRVNLGHPAGAPTYGPGAPHQWWRALWSRREWKVAEIRQLMLAQVQALPRLPRQSVLAAQILAAEQPEALWALRDALTHVLVEAHGEALARRRMTDITFMFAGLLHRERPAGTGDTHNSEGAMPWSPNPAARGLVRRADQAQSDH